MVSVLMAASPWLCAAVIVLGTGSLRAQQQEAVLQRIELPGAGFNIALASSKSPAETIDLSNSPGALMCAFQANDNDGRSTKIFSVYVVPEHEMTAPVRTGSIVRLSLPAMRKVEVPGTNFAIVFATTMTPIAWEAHERPDALAFHSIGDEFIMATDGDIKRMFKDVGLSQWPTCAFYVEHKGSNPLQAASVYIVPKGDATAF